MSSYTTAIVSPHDSVRSPSLYVQGKLLFSSFLTRNKGTTDESKKRLRRYQQEQLNLPREYSVFDGSQCIVNNRKFKMRRRRGSEINNFFEGRKQAMTKFNSLHKLGYIWLIEIQLQKSSLAFDKE